MNADVPQGFFSASGAAAGSAPSLRDIRQGTFGHRGWMHRHHHGNGKTDETGITLEEIPSERPASGEGSSVGKDDIANVAPQKAPIIRIPTGTQYNADGYPIAPKVPWKTSFAIGLKSFGKWMLTLKGFLITVYFLNVVAWGGMLFLVLIGGAPAMCPPGEPPTCNGDNTTRRIWIENTSQILNALFCLTGFGLAPWRFRDLYWLLVYRIPGRTKEKRQVGIRRLAGIHNDWFRLAGSQNWAEEGVDDEHNPSVPLPLRKKLNPPATGVRAEPTATWKMDFVVWCNVWNTLFQICLAFFMWNYNRLVIPISHVEVSLTQHRITRPNWATGLFIALAFGVSGAGGIMILVQGKKVKKVEGVLPKGVTGGADGQEKTPA
jgi:hypothetical protein